MQCFKCKGNMENKETTLIVEVDGQLLNIKDVPSHVCSQCGEVSYSDDVVKKVEAIVKEKRLS